MMEPDRDHRRSSFDVNIPVYSSQKTVSFEIPLKSGTGLMRAFVWDIYE